MGCCGNSDKKQTNQGMSHNENYEGNEKKSSWWIWIVILLVIMLVFSFF